MGLVTFKSVRVPHNARSWSQLDARWREGFIAGLRAAELGMQVRVIGTDGDLEVIG